MPPRKPSESTHPSDSASKYTAFRCPSDLLALAKIRAKKDRRSLSNYLIVLIEKDVEGMELPATPPVQGKRLR